MSLPQVTTAYELDQRSIQQRANRGGILCERRPRGDGCIDAYGILLGRDRGFGRLPVVVETRVAGLAPNRTRYRSTPAGPVRSLGLRRWRRLTRGVRPHQSGVPMFASKKVNFRRRDCVEGFYIGCIIRRIRRNSKPLSYLCDASSGMRIACV